MLGNYKGNDLTGEICNLFVYSLRQSPWSLCLRGESSYN
jgi:hypothetical protein